MEDIISSRLLWGVGLYTPVDLGGIFKTRDLTGKGIVLDSMLTVVEAPGMILPRAALPEDIEMILGAEKHKELMEYCKDEKFRNVFNLFELDSYADDNIDVIALRLKRGNEFFGILNLLNKGLRVKYKAPADDEYTPHIILAEVRRGEANKYLENPSLNQILNESKVDFEDLLVESDLGTGEPRQLFLTHFKNVDRYFRLEELKKSEKELKEMEKGDDDLI